MKVDLEYYKAKSEKYAKAINIVIDVTYNTIKPRLGNKLEPYGEFRDAILSSVKDRL